MALPPIEEIEKQKGYWDFETFCGNTYKCYVYMVAKDRVSRILLRGALKAIKLKLKVKTNDREIMKKYEKIEEFDVDHRYYNFLKTKVGGLLKGVIKEVKEDGLVLLSFKVDRCQFKKHDKKWLIKMSISGLYDKR